MKNTSLKYEYNKEEFDGKSEMPTNSFVICSTPRSGSTLLAKGLAETKVAGMPHEYFNEEHMMDFKKRWEFSNIEEYIELLKKNRVSENGTFGFKIHHFQYMDVLEDNPLHDKLADLKYIYIYRKDVLSQAISLEKASQTGQWSSEFVVDKRHNSLKFNFLELQKKCKLIQNENLLWINYFKKHQISPLKICYEDLESGYSNQILKALDYIGVTYSHKNNLKPVINKQRNISNLIWKIRFLLLKPFKG